MDFKDWQRSVAVNPPKDGGRELLSTPSGRNWKCFKDESLKPERYIYNYVYSARDFTFWNSYCCA